MNKFVLLCCCTLAYLNGFSQSLTRESFFTDSLDNYVHHALEQWKIPGVAVAVIKDGKWIVQKGYGVRELGTGTPVDEHTLFGIGSNTKAFTGTALAMLQAQGKLSLNDKVKKWVTDFQVFDPWVTKEMIIRDLLSHRMDYETFQGDFMYFDSDLSYQEVKQKFGQLQPVYGFRTRWGYTNAGYAIAGEIIQKASGMPYHEFIKTQIFEPIGMNNSLATSGEYEKASNISKAHTVAEGELKKINYGNLDNMAPAGVIASSAHDMGLWAMTLLNKGVINNKQVMSEAAVAAPMMPHSIMGNGGHPYNRAQFNLYGLGWFLQSYEGRRIVEHTGGVNGFVTSFTLVPEEKLAIVVLTNTDSNNFYEALKSELLDAALHLPYRNYSGEIYADHAAYLKETEANLKAKKDSVALTLPPAVELNKFVGTYKHTIYGKMTIAMEKNQLVARFEHHPGRFAVLGSLGGNRFLASFNEALFGNPVWPFTIKSGKIQSVTVTVSDFIEFTPYEFIKQ